MKNEKKNSWDIFIRCTCKNEVQQYITKYKVNFVLKPNRKIYNVKMSKHEYNLKKYYAL